MGPALERLLCVANKQICDNNWCFVAGNTAGPADFCVAGIMANMVDPKTSGTDIPAEAKAAMKCCFEKYPKVCAAVQKTLCQDKLAAYLAARPMKP